MATSGISSTNDHMKVQWFEAADKGDAKLIRELLTMSKEKRFPVVTGMNTGATALHLASAKGHTDIVELLLKHDPTIVNEPDVSQKTALILACEGGHHAVVETLLKYRADVNYQTASVPSALYCACQRSRDSENQKATVDLLLRYGAEIDAVFEGKRAKDVASQAVCALIDEFSNDVGATAAARLQRELQRQNRLFIQLEQQKDQELRMRNYYLQQQQQRKTGSNNANIGSEVTTPQSEQCKVQ